MQDKVELLVERQTVSRERVEEDEEQSCPADKVEKLVVRLLALEVPPSQFLQDLSCAIDDSAELNTSYYAKDFFILRLIQSMQRGEWAKDSIQKLVAFLADKCGSWSLYHGILGTLKELSTSALRNDRSITLDICLNGIELLLFDDEENPVTVSLWSNQTTVDEPATVITQVIVALPNLIAQAQDSIHDFRIPAQFVREAFHTRLVEAASAFESSRQSQELVRHLLRRNGGEAVVVGLFRRWTRAAVDKTEQKQVKSFVAALELSDREAAIWIRTVLRHHVASASDDAWMQCVCHDWISRCWEAVCELVVLETSSVVTTATGRQRPVVDPRLCRAYAELLRSCTAVSDDDEEDVGSISDQGFACDSLVPEDKLLWGCLELVAQQWSTTYFVRHTDELLQQHASHFLRHGLELLGEVPIENLFNMELVQGVSERLKSSILSVRLDGMRVAVSMAKLQGQELSFAELDEEGRESQEQVDLPVMPDVVEVTRLSEAGNETDRFDLEDDQEDLLIVPKPLYLSECLDLLRTADNDENAGLKQETALRHVSDLVRSRPADLWDHAPELARTILRTRNRCHLDNYSSLERTALCSLVTQDPRAVGLELIGEIFQDGVHNDRLAAMRALMDGATELSGKTTLFERIPPIKNTERISGKGSFLIQKGTPLEQNEIKTTRWGHGKRRNQQPIVTQNHFKEVGPVWFYALTKRFIETKDKSNLWGYETGSYLLSQWLDTLNGIVFCVGPFAPAIDMMVKSIWEFSWVFRDAEVPEVRLSVLRSFATVLEMHQQDPSLALDAPQELPRYLKNVVSKDAEENCRLLASSLLDAVSTRSLEQPLIEAASTVLKKP